jgi:ribonuclease P protein component
VERLASDRRCFPRTARITCKAEYNRVFTQGEKVRGGIFVCFILVNASEETRLGVIASRKVGRATARNRVKRLVREFFRLHRGRFPQGFQLVVVARATSAQAEGTTCMRELERMLARWMHHA